MPAVIARIRLAQGELGYIDELSGVYLNWAQPEKDIFEGTNCTNLRRSVKAHRIILLAGSLGRPKTLNELLHKIEPPGPKPIYEVDSQGRKKTRKEKVEKPKATESEPAPVVEKEPVVEEVKTEPEQIALEEIKAEPIEEQPVVEEKIVEAVEEIAPAEEAVTVEEEIEPEEKPKKKKTRKKS